MSVFLWLMMPVIPLVLGYVMGMIHMRAYIEFETLFYTLLLPVTYIFATCARGDVDVSLFLLTFLGYPLAYLTAIWATRAKVHFSSQNNQGLFYFVVTFLVYCLGMLLGVYRLIRFL